MSSSSYILFPCTCFCVFRSISYSCNFFSLFFLFYLGQQLSNILHPLELETTPFQTSIYLSAPYLPSPPTLSSFCVSVSLGLSVFFSLVHAAVPTPRLFSRPLYTWFTYKARRPTLQPRPGVWGTTAVLSPPLRWYKRACVVYIYSQRLRIDSHSQDQKP